MSTLLLVLACLYSASYASHDQIHVPQYESCGTPITYAMITPSPEAVPYPITRQGQEITSYVPQYAVCNADNSDCTTIYSTHTYNWCSTVIPCYGSACTVTDCAQAVTFSHENSYALQKTVCPTAGEYTIHGTETRIPSPTTVYYVQPVTTKYAMPYLEYAAGRYGNVEVEKCVEIYPGKEVCEVYVERWVEEVVEKEKKAVLPVTMHTYCPEPTTITFGGEIVVVETPTTYTFVTERTETVMATEIRTKRTSTLTSTITLSRNYPTPEPYSTTPCETTYSPEPTPEYTIQEHYTTTTEPCSDTTIKPSPTSITTEEDTTSTIILTATSTVTTILRSLTPIPSSSASSTPQKRAEPVYPVPYKASKPIKPPTYVYTKDALAAEYKQSGSVHSYGEYADESKQEDASQALYSKAPLKARAEEYAYDAACAGEADGSVHSYGQYADHEEGYRCSQSGYARKGVAYPAYKSVGQRYKAAEPQYKISEPEYKTKEPEYKASDSVYTTAEPEYKAPESNYKFAEPEYKAAEPEYKPVEPQYKTPEPEYKAAEPEYKPVEPQYKAPEPEYKAAEPEYKPVESQYKAPEPEYKASVPEYKTTKPEYKTMEPQYKAPEPEYKAAEPKYEPQYKFKERRDEYAYEAAGAGNADGQAHSYGRYADHEEEYRYSQDGYRKETTGYPKYKPTKPVEPKYKSVDRRDEYAYTASGSGEADGQVHSYSQYADHEEGYEYSQDGYSKESSAPVYHKVKSVTRDEYSASSSNSGKASGEVHSYGQYADYSEGYEASEGQYAKEGPRSRKGARDDYAYEASAAGRASGEVHSYGQYADYSEEYGYSKGEASRKGSVYRKYRPIKTKSENGEASVSASGERHSYGQYADYEKDANTSYESEETRYKPNRKGSKKGDNSYSYGVEGEDRGSYY